MLVSSGARADLGQSDVGLVIVDDALAVLPASADDELRRRLMEVKAERLTELGRTEEAEAVIAEMPAEVEDTDIIDVALYQDADVDNKRSPLRGCETAWPRSSTARCLTWTAPPGPATNVSSTRPPP